MMTELVVCPECGDEVEKLEWCDGCGDKMCRDCIDDHDCEGDDD
jgi:hypothetical protein